MLLQIVPQQSALCKMPLTCQMRWRCEFDQIYLNTTRMSERPSYV